MISTITLSYLWLTKALASWPDKLFNAKSANDVVASLTQDKPIQASDKINIKAPEIAENGAVVPVTVETDLPGIKTISILVDNNPSPLTSVFNLSDHLLPFVSTRVKMAETSQVVALVENQQGDFFSAARSIKVTIGGCGG
jgi:sulfur-oxidizing protein SoxY